MPPEEVTAQESILRADLDEHFEKKGPDDVIAPQRSIQMGRNNTSVGTG